MGADLALEELLLLAEDYHDFNPCQVARASQYPSTTEFSKQVSKGLPCVYPANVALTKCRASFWARDTLVRSVEETVEVAVTPNGRADSLCTLPNSQATEKVFLQPGNVDMTLEELLDKLDNRGEHAGPVYYLQSQNSNLTSTPLERLLKDLPQNLDFAQPVVGEPEAVNIWIGDERSVTSAHRDPYENLYIVLRGSKTFTLWAPVDEICMNALMVRTGRYVFDAASSGFSVKMDDADEDSEHPPKIPWIPIDPQQPRRQLDKDYPLYKYARPKVVTVTAGEMLYLPSGWYHHVSQECGTWDDGSKAPCIAINYWYDMDYEGEKHVTRQLIGRLAQRVLRTYQDSN